MLIYVSGNTQVKSAQVELRVAPEGVSMSGITRADTGVEGVVVLDSVEQVSCFWDGDVDPGDRVVEGVIVDE